MDNTRRIFLTQAAASLGLFYLSGLTPEILAQAHEHAKSAPRNLDARAFRFSDRITGLARKGEI